MLAHLIKQGYQADGVEMHYLLARQAAENRRKSMSHCMVCLHDDAGVLDGRYHAVGLFDGLEHIAEQSPFLRHCAEVPALMVWWWQPCRPWARCAPWWTS